MAINSFGPCPHPETPGCRNGRPNASSGPAAAPTCSASATWWSSTRATYQMSQAMVSARPPALVPGRQAGYRAPISRSDASQILWAPFMSRSGGHSICSEGAPPTSARLGP